MPKPKRILVLGTHSSLLALTLLRVVVGAIMVAHGFQKVVEPSQFQHHVAQLGIPFPAVTAYLAIAAEFLGGLGLITGFFTRFSALGVSATLFVAIISVHLKHGLFAANGGFEYPLTLMCAALWFIAAGAGPYSLDALLRAAREDRTGGLPYARPVVTESPRESRDSVDVITQAGKESFPASDPPAHSGRQL